MNGNLSAHFDINICTQCPLKDQCPVKFQKKDTVLRVSQKSLMAENNRLILMERKIETKMVVNVPLSMEPIPPLNGRMELANLECAV